jgi:hypothetical protein
MAKMFLLKIKEKSPGLFWCLIVFCFLQITLTLIKLEVTPFFLYGMYSEKFYVTDTISIYKEKLNGHLLSSQIMNKWEEDILRTGIENYNAQLRNNKIDIIDTRISTKHPSIYNSRVFEIIKKHIMNDSVSLNRFPDWYKQKFYQYTGMDIKTFEVVNETYLIDFNNKKYQLISNEKIFELK